MGGLLLFGLFVAALSSVLGGLVGPPRVLQRIAEDNVLPILKPFAQTVGIPYRTKQCRTKFPSALKRFIVETQGCIMREP